MLLKDDNIVILIKRISSSEIEYNRYMTKMKHTRTRRLDKIMFKRRLTAAVLVALAIMLVPLGAFAEFTDLGDAPWAANYIEEMAEERIVTGYEDGTFKPNDNISKYASVLMLYRTVKAADLVSASEQTVNISRHMTTIASKGVPNWPDMYGAVAYCLEEGIITSADLDNFRIGDSYTNARRFEVAVFLGKAMNIYLDENLNVLYSLDFKDSSSIVSAARPYVYLLNKNDVINGDTEGYFNPNSPITRAAMSKMLSVSLNLLKDETPDENTKAGEITSILGDTSRVVVRDLDDESVSNLYNLTDVEILIDGRSKEVDDLQVEMNVLLSFSGDSLVKLSVTDDDVSSDLLEYDGIYKNYIDMGSYAILTIEMPNGDREAYKILNTTTISKDGEEVLLVSLKSGDPVNMETDADYITELEVFSMTQTYDGIFIEVVENDDYDAVKIKDDAGKYIDIELSDDVDVEKNDRNREISDLINGDFVVVTTEYSKAVGIVASGLETNAEGIIKSILIAEEPEITVVDSDDVEKTYTLHDDVDIEVDGYDRSIYELRLDYTVSLVAQGDVVTSIDAESTSSSDNIDGYVITVDSSSDRLRVRYYDGEDYVFKYVYMKSGTDIYLEDGDDGDFDDIDANDKVFVYGQTIGTKFYADRIFILE